MALQEGKAAPAFTLKDGRGKSVSLKDFRGQNVIVYFYPKDDTPGCTVEACGFRDLWKEIQKRGAVVLGISPDGAASHEKFTIKYKLPFTLLSDTDKTAVRLYDVDGLLGIGVRRATYLIDEQGIIVDAVLADLRIDRHRRFIERAIATRERGSSP